MFLTLMEWLYVIGGFLLIIGAFAKSAQIGLHVWLVDAMEGPTPVSALIHAATMVTAGVFLLLRFDVFFSSIYYLDLYLLIGITGGITSLLSGIAATMQTDIKKLIAYSTVSQIGYMFIAIGAFFPEGALYHLTTHAFFKALLFLCSGVIIYYLGDEKNGRIILFFSRNSIRNFYSKFSVNGFSLFIRFLFKRFNIRRNFITKFIFIFVSLFFSNFFSIFNNSIFIKTLYICIFFRI
jgi:NADH:ubiquinone oxidoreductase subunit 5 (subunit L)/multisubunit Na+/H+ antiporter MnhA subunit